LLETTNVILLYLPPEIASGALIAVMLPVILLSDICIDLLVIISPALVI